VFLIQIYRLRNDAELFWLYARMGPCSHQEPVPVDDTIELSEQEFELFWLYARKGPCSHQEPVPVDDTIELSEQELEERSNKNVERWVSLHIIPVCGLCFHPHPRKSRLTSPDF
jgi:hypothetical protein